MRRFIAPGFAALLLTASFVGATPVPSTPASPASLSPLDAGACSQAALPLMIPNAVERTDFPICGACSVAVCVGADDGTICGTTSTSEIKYCRPWGPTCQDGPPADVRCICTTLIAP
jgi:hypothetical protein